jgi:large subunit ribosomal protein L29
VKIERMSEMSAEELRHEEEKLAEQIFRFRFQLQTGNVENPSRLGQTRRDLARVKTIVRERELGIERHRRAAEAGDRDAGKGAGREDT